MSIYTAKFSQFHRFYVYAYIRELESINGVAGSPYYIGKGTKRRAYTKKNLEFRPPKNRIQIIHDNMNEADAFQLEMLLIHLYGRIDLGTGCLRNRTDGGDGAFGNKGPLGQKRSIETRQRISANHADVGGEKNPMFGKIHQKESIELMRKNLPDRKNQNNPFYGKTFSEDVIEQKRKDRLGRVWIFHPITEVRKTIHPEKFCMYEELGFVIGYLNPKKRATINNDNRS